MRPEQTPAPLRSGAGDSVPSVAGAADPGRFGDPVGSDRFAEAARRCALGREDLALRGHAPDGQRRLRRFGAHELARWRLGLTVPELRRRLREDPSLPQGAPETPGGPPWFDFAEALALEARLGPERKRGPLRRPAGAGPRIMAVANFKGGVGKTSLAASLAMAGALDGLRVLAVDLDSQGSLTSIFGARIDDAWETAYPLLARDYARARVAAGLEPGDEALERALEVAPADVIRPTHWPGIDLVGAQLDLYWAEFQIPVWRLALRSWKLWDALGAALEEAAQGYDLVILDTPPALGYLTINALAAADILLVPLGASFLEFESTGRFFDMLHATFASIEEGEARAAEAAGKTAGKTGGRAAGQGAPRFEWDAVRCVLTRYDAAQQAEMAAVMAHWFGDLMAERRLEATALVGQAGEQTKAIYEADPKDFDPRTYARGRETFDRVWEEVRGLLAEAWAREAAAEGPGARRETEETV